jgi:tetratricopeptide (TPR) repeat protein
MALWEKAVSITKKTSTTNPNDVDKKLIYALAHFGLLNATMAEEDETQFDKYLDETKVTLESLIEEGSKMAEGKALLSSVYGLQMGYSPMKGMFLGSKSSSLIEEALKAKPNTPMINKIYAGSKLFTPEMFGGDVNLSIKHFEKAIAKYELDSALIQNNWLYLDTHAFLGIAYKKVNRLDDAILLYNKILKVEPEYSWVSNVLLPRAENSKNTDN